MSPEMLVYPFLFIAIFFESFILITLLSAPARAARARAPATSTPTVAVIVPCWNEARTVASTVESLLSLEYPKNKLEILLVDDGSTDDTKGAMANYALNKQVKIILKENGGKHTALNAGIESTTAELIGCLDADSFVESDALKEIVACFDSKNVAAAIAAISIHKPKNIFQHMQHAEFYFGITLRHAFASMNGLPVTPGPFSFYRRSVLEELGGFKYAHQSEDLEIALRIQKAGYTIENAPRARVYTKAPDTLASLMRQRTRWTSGFFRNIFGEYRSLLATRRHGALGLFVLPTAIISIGSSIILFVMLLVSFSLSTISTIQIRFGIPFSYSLVPRGMFDLFYFPVSTYLFLGITVLLISISFIVIGKSISRTEGSFSLGVASYTVLYGLIAPIWFLLATTDVVRGKRRGWRY